MPGLEDVFQFMLSIDVFDIIKLMVVLGLGFYLVFAVIVVRQVELMKRTLNGAIDVPLKILALVHLGVAFLVFGLAIAIL
ncbi:MAG: hypothetical protein HYS86_03735 [Candidatus Chisholmbacteria bacterium]|nr:hypothetical protein [Candidatus Chisholmbacteria bacterium]